MENKRYKTTIKVLLAIIIAMLAISFVLFIMWQNEKKLPVATTEKLDGDNLEENKDTEEVLENTDAEIENIADASEDMDISPDVLSRLSVRDCRIIDENGKVVQLKGMSTHGLLWYPEYTNYAAIKTTKDYGANAFRIAMYANEPNGGYIQSRDMSTKLLRAAVENVKAAGMYAIIDWHVLNEHNPIYDVEAAKAFFKETSELYGNDPQIIYEICNEPNNEATWEDIKNYANQVIPIIRENAPDSLIIVGTPEYSYNIRAVLSDKLDYDNLLFSFHFYAGQFNDDYKDILKECDDAGIAAIISEWGINTDGTPGALSQGKEFISYINNHKISWFAWSLCNKQECFSAIKSDCYKLSGWEEDDLTEVGKVFFDAFRE